MFAFDFMRSAMGKALARYLSKPLPHFRPLAASDPDSLSATLRPGDILLVEGNTRVATAIKYLTQSTWSHAAFYVGVIPGVAGDGPEPKVLIEADLVEGVWAVPLSMYARLQTRVCRPIGLSNAEIDRVVQFMVASLGKKYDLKNIIDLARYVLPEPPVPTRWRRRMISLGSGEPTKAICSTLIAQAYQSIRYPILPIRSVVPAATDDCVECVEEFYSVRHHSLFAPRDFDISPYFEVVKPSLEQGFDFRELRWADLVTNAGAPTGTGASDIAANRN